MDPFSVARLVRWALAEDIGHGDLTTEAVVPAGTRARGLFVARERGVVAGLPVAEQVFRCLASDVEFRALVPEGREVASGEVIAEVAGDARALLAGERTALNFLQRLSGIATLTARLVALVEPYGVRLVDTRKTTPGLRVLEKYAVRVGGGHNHRFGLYDGVLIKDNHIRLAGGVRRAVERVRGRVPHTVRIEVEVEDPAQVAEALEAGADAVLL
ncbi:MAG: carboxylating nicotinate-nucleotide diphosphorylase, partial [Firmicutes bacterium]|nr:carboxylating nicotinate-nucleotide diphosphorylase [Bacillota bacterium]